MTAANIQTLLPAFRNRIMAGGVGKYLLQTGAPSAAGTWVQMGATMTDQLKDVASVNYSGDYTGSYSGSYSRFFAGFLNANYTGSYSGTYTNVEYDLTTSSRGSRNSYLTESMKTLLNAEDVAFVNNNASSLYLTLLCLSKKYSKDSVIVSRGEIIEIGGSYRLPDIIFETGMKLIEVGTTNKTKIKDNVFIGSNSSLVAPVIIEKNSTVGAGSVITKNVKKKSLALSRSLQTEIKNYKRKSK